MNDRKGLVRSQRGLIEGAKGERKRGQTESQRERAVHETARCPVRPLAIRWRPYVRSSPSSSEIGHD